MPIGDYNHLQCVAHVVSALLRFFELNYVYQRTNSIEECNLIGGLDLDYMFNSSQQSLIATVKVCSHTLLRREVKKFIS